MNFAILYSEKLQYALGWTLLHSLWQGLTISILTGILLLFLQKKSSKLRYLVANIGLWYILAAAIITFLYYYKPTDVTNGQFNFRPDYVAAAEVVDVHHTANNTINHEANYSFWNFDRLQAYFNQHIYSIVLLWFFGASLFLLRLLGNISYVFYLRNRLNFPVDEYWQEQLDGLRQKLNIDYPISLMESALVRSPLVLGYLKPMILFPIGAINRLEIHEVEAILAHELAHVMRHDYLINILQNVIEAIFYFHPAVWWLSSQIRIERENCCDDIAITICGNAMIYARALVSVQEMAYYSPQLALAFAGSSRKKHLLLRVQRILNQPKSKLNMMEKVVSSTLVLCILGGFVFGGSLFTTTPFALENGLPISRKNTENQLVASSNIQYLKYEINGKLDSMPVSKSITDGHYTFNNNLYEVDMTVKNQRLILLSINGLPIEGKDMPKFEKMITQLVNEQQDDVINGDSIYEATYIDGQNITLHRGNNDLETLKSLDNGGMELNIQRNGENVKVIYKKGKITINGKPATVKELEKLDWTMHENGIQPIGGFPNMQPPPLPPLPPVPDFAMPPDAPELPEIMTRLLPIIVDVRERSDDLKRQGLQAQKLMDCDRLLNDLDQSIKSGKLKQEAAEVQLGAIEAKLEALQAKFEADKQKMETKQQGNSSFSFSTSHVDTDDDNPVTDEATERFGKWLELELKKDSYISNTKRYSYVWNNNMMSVNGTKVKDTDRKKYVMQYQTITGRDMGKRFDISVSVEND